MEVKLPALLGNCERNQRLKIGYRYAPKTHIRRNVQNIKARSVSVSILRLFMVAVNSTIQQWTFHPFTPVTPESGSSEMPASSVIFS